MSLLGQSKLDAYTNGQTLANWNLHYQSQAFDSSWQNGHCAQQIPKLRVCQHHQAWV
jgi:hypothetical protein